MSVLCQMKEAHLVGIFFDEENGEDFSTLNLIAKKEKFKEEKYDF